MTPHEIDESNLVDRAISAFRWVATLRLLGQIFSWLSTIFVIRFLAPEDYGVISLAEIFRTFFVLFSTVGISQGLMKVENLTDSMIRKSLGLLFIINASLFILQYSIAPYAAAFYESDDLEKVLKFLAFFYLLIPWTSVPSSLVARNLEHKKTSKITFATDLLASCLSLTLAWLGYGYWALIMAIAFTGVFNCFWFNRIIDYPKLPSFVLRGADELFKFGIFVAFAEVIFVAYSRIDVMIAGRYLDIAQIGFYGVAIQLATMLMTKSVPLFNVVAFPAFARKNALSGGSNEYLLMTLRFASTIVFPVFLGLALVGEDLIPLVLGSTWSQITGIFVILVVSVPLRIMAYIISPALLAAGGARTNMTNGLVTLVFLTGAIFTLLPFGLYGVAVSWSLASICIFVLMVIRGGGVLGLQARDVCAAVAPGLFVSLVMCLVVYILDFYNSGIEGIFSLYKVPVGACVYVACFWYLFRERSREMIHVTLRLTGRQ